MKDGFSAIRSDHGAELHGVEAGLRTEIHGVAAGLRTEFRTELHEVRDALRSDIRELREDIRIGVQESQNLARGLHAEAMAAVAALDTSIRHDLGAKLDQILALHEDERPT